MNLGGLSLKLRLEPSKKIRARMCWSAQRCKCVVVDCLLFTLSVGHWKIAIFGGRSPQVKEKN